VVSAEVAVVEDPAESVESVESVAIVAIVREDIDVGTKVRRVRVSVRRSEVDMVVDVEALLPLLLRRLMQSGEWCTKDFQDFSLFSWASWLVWRKRLSFRA
jgi:hypothetical protein